jgi:hypothetical protein
LQAKNHAAEARYVLALSFPKPEHQARATWMRAVKIGLWVTYFMVVVMMAFLLCGWYREGKKLQKRLEELEAQTKQGKDKLN